MMFVSSIIDVHYLLLFITVRIDWWCHSNEVFIVVQRSGDGWLVDVLDISEALICLNI